MAINKTYSNRELFGFFQSKLSSLGTETAVKYRRAISDLDLFLTGHRLQLSSLSPVMVADWTVELLRRGLSKTTVVRHLNILSSLIRSAAKRNMLPQTDAPRDLAKKLTASNLPLPPLMREEQFAEALSKLRTALKEPKSVEEDLLLYSLLRGAMPLEETAMLRKRNRKDSGSTSDTSSAESMVVSRNTDSRRDFIFNLRQSYSTPKQVMKRVEEVLKADYGRFAGSGLRTESDKSGRGEKAVAKRTCAAQAADKSSRDDKAGFDADKLVKALWVAIALKSGATASEALRCVGAEASYALPDFYRLSDFTQTPTEPESRQLWINTVNAVLTHDMPRWYAMHLRRGVDYNELCKDIAESIRPMPELFYPSETIKKRVGNKTVIDDKPFISHTVFFKSYPEKILPMFNKIGDKAWCYRVTRGSGSPYAVISPREMQRFQAVIGVFTPDIEVHPIGTLTPKPGETVIVIKAGYSNRPAEVEDVVNDAKGSVVVRVKLSTDSGYEWRLDLTPSQLRSLS